MHLEQLAFGNADDTFESKRLSTVLQAMTLWSKYHLGMHHEC